MKEEILKSLIRELFGMDTLHKEYQDDNTHYVIDSLKENDTLIIKVQFIENKDKKEFESWLTQVDDDLFQEVLEELGEPNDLETLYQTENYKEVIDKVKSKTKELALKHINRLKLLL